MNTLKSIQHTNGTIAPEETLQNKSYSIWEEFNCCISASQRILQDKITRIINMIENAHTIEETIIEKFFFSSLNEKKWIKIVYKMALKAMVKKIPKI